MDKLIQSSFGSIIYYIVGNVESAKKYENMAMKEYEKNEDSIKAMFGDTRHKNKRNSRYIGRVEDIVPQQVKKKLYEMVS